MHALSWTAVSRTLDRPHPNVILKNADNRVPLHGRGEWRDNHNVLRGVQVDIESLTYGISSNWISHRVENYM